MLKDRDRSVQGDSNGGLKGRNIYDANWFIYGKTGNKDSNQIGLEAFYVYNGSGNKAYLSEPYNKIK